MLHDGFCWEKTDERNWLRAVVRRSWDSVLQLISLEAIFTFSKTRQKRLCGWILAFGTDRENC